MLVPVRLFWDNDLVEIDGQEKSFRQDKALVFDLQNGKSVHVNGTIDRLDTLQINRAVGVVDYKSSDQSFQLGIFTMVSNLSW